MEPKDRQLKQMGEAECLRRLISQRVGRLAFVVEGRPQVFCVNFTVGEGRVLFRTHDGSVLLSACGAWVGFHVDQIDEWGHQGWSVLVEGVAAEVTGRAAADLLQAVEPWAPGEKSRLIAIRPTSITGRELTVRQLGWPLDDSGYL